MDELITNAHLDRMYDHANLGDHLSEVLWGTIERAGKCTLPELCELADRLNVSPCRQALEPLVVALLRLAGRTVFVNAIVHDMSLDVEEAIRRRRSGKTGGFTPRTEIGIISPAYFE